MAISLIKEEEKHMLNILPVLLRQDVKFKDALYDVLGETFAKKDDFAELKGIVKEIGIKVSELAEAQKRTEIKVEELAEAQKRTEIKVKELAEAQKRTEIKVEELAEAQKRTEIRVEELAKAQKRTEIRVEELAEAQKRTEKGLQELIKEHKKTRKQLGGLSITVGYTLENEALKALPELLKRDFGFIIEDRLKRQYVVDNEGKYIEINITGSAKKDGRKITIIGESKTQLSKNAVNEFIRKKIERVNKVYEEIFPVLVTHMTSEPDTEEYAKGKGIALYYSYDF